jgi:hypothetical protein
MSFDNRKHKSLAPENVMTDTEYAFTINISDDNRYKTIQRRVYNYYSVMNTLKHCSYQLCFEFSSIGRLHAHGLLKITNKMEFYSRDIPILVEHFSFEIDTIGVAKIEGGSSPTGDDAPSHSEATDTGGREKWLKYCNKNKADMDVFMAAYNLQPLFTNNYVAVYMNKSRVLSED